MDLLDALGIATPRRLEFRDAAGAARLPDPPLPGSRVVLKLLSPDVVHKTEASAVRVLDNRRDAIVAEVREMERRFATLRIAGFMICEHIPHDAGIGHEFLLGAHWSREFGPIVTLGPGGIHAEFLARALREDEALSVAAPCGEGEVARALAGSSGVRLASEPQRGMPARVSREAFADVVARFRGFARDFVPEPVAEFEVNPLVVSGGRLVALDARIRLTAVPEREPPPRPPEKIARLLAPRSIAVVGASERMNPGHIILRNILARGFPPGQVTVVRPGTDRLDGCRCVPTLAELPGRVDLVVLSVPAPTAAEMIAQIADQSLAESVVLISGGLEERPGMEAHVARMHEALWRARGTPWGGPVVNGGNCLGIRSAPGRYDTLFIPPHKLPPPAGPAGPLALITASGAFAISKASKLARIEPRYLITLGNQTDLTVGDYLEHLRHDPEVGVFGVYLEGFRPLDGARTLRAIEAIARSGRIVVLYRAGRTSAGAGAAASHTAAVAGDARVTRRVAEAAGALVAESLEDFEDLVRITTLLRGRDPRGPALGALSNAGYECVAIADALGPLRLARWGEATRDRLGAILERARLSHIVPVRNPIDLTPLLADADYEATARAVLEDPGVDVGVVGCVPLTPALATLAGGSGHDEDLGREDSIVSRLLRLRLEIAKPWVAVVDAGPLYDPMVRALEEGGVPTFRTADRALRLFGRWCAHRLRADPERSPGTRTHSDPGPRSPGA
jgi:acyl-CoA synthetase (NDP forming)